MTQGRLATILLGHGARDPRWAEPFGRLRDAVAFALPGVDVSLAFLELMTPDVHAAAATAIAAGCTQITVVPIFFGVGAHVRRDLPERLAVLRATHPGIVFTLADAAGEDASVLNALAAYCIRVATSD